MDEFEQTKAYLRQANAHGRSLYDHLVDVLSKTIKEKPHDALAAFEKISVAVKQAYVGSEHLKEVVADQRPSSEQAIQAIQRVESLLKPSGKDDEEEPAAVPDLMADAELLEWAGIGLNKSELFKLSLSIQELASSKRLENVRFFGKVFGLQRDYYICECKGVPQNDQANADKNPKIEAQGSGANQFTYFASNSPTGDWFQLEDVTPEHIIVSRQCRRLLTGNLKAPVLGFPRFGWGEAAYLRAIIARIGAATIVAPQQQFSVADEGSESGEIQLDEEYKGVRASDLQSPEHWVHIRRGLLKQGRCDPYVEPEREDEATEPSKLEDAEEPLPILAPLSNDQSNLPSTWTFRLSPNVGRKPSENEYAVASAHSLVWPGAVAVSKKRSLVNIYIGNGLKRLIAPYAPPPPPSVQSEYVPHVDPEQEDSEPHQEQEDPLPPKDLPEEKEEDEIDDSGDDLEDPNEQAAEEEEEDDEQ